MLMQYVTDELNLPREAVVYGGSNSHSPDSGTTSGSSVGVGSALETEVSEDALLSFVLPAHALHPKIRSAESKRAVICFFFILLYLFKHKR